MLLHQTGTAVGASKFASEEGNTCDCVAAGEDEDLFTFLAQLNDDQAPDPVGRTAGLLPATAATSHVLLREHNRAYAPSEFPTTS
jgi:hypothetical protein